MTLPAEDNDTMYNVHVYNVHVYMHVCTCTYTWISMYMYIVYVHVHVCIYCAVHVLVDFTSKAVVIFVRRAKFLNEEQQHQRREDRNP